MSKFTKDSLTFFALAFTVSEILQCLIFDLKNMSRSRSTIFTTTQSRLTVVYHCRASYSPQGYLLRIPHRLRVPSWTTRNNTRVVTCRLKAGSEDVPVLLEGHTLNSAHLMNTFTNELSTTIYNSSASTIQPFVVYWQTRSTPMSRTWPCYEPTDYHPCPRQTDNSPYSDSNAVSLTRDWLRPSPFAPVTHRR